MCVHHSMYVVIVTYESYSISMTVDASRDNYTSSGKEQTQKGCARRTSTFMSSFNKFIYNRHMHFLVCKRLICTYHRALL